MRKKRWLSSVHQVTHLRLEVEDRTDLMGEHKAEFEKLVSEELGSDYIPNTPEPTNDPISTELIPYGDRNKETNHSEESKEEPPTANPPPQMEEDSSEDAESESLKKLWKAIALATHPDRNPNNQHYHDLYKRAHQAYQSKSYEVLLEIAVELNISLPDPDEAMVKALGLRKTSLESKLRDIDTMVLWMWINADDAKKKDLIRAAAAVYRGKRRKS
jgi:hypothetical protein